MRNPSTAKNPDKMAQIIGYLFRCKKCGKRYKARKLKHIPKKCKTCQHVKFHIEPIKYRSWECKSCGRRITTQRGNDIHPEDGCWNCSQDDWSRIPLQDKPRKSTIRYSPSGYPGRGGEIKPPKSNTQDE